VRGNTNFLGTVFNGDFIVQMSYYKILTHAILCSTRSVDVQDLSDLINPLDSVVTKCVIKLTLKYLSIIPIEYILRFVWMSEQTAIISHTALTG